MITIEELLEQMKADPLCKVLPPAGLPVLPDGLKLPADFEYFYQQCGGVQCFYNTDYNTNFHPFDIEPPQGFTSANAFCLSNLSYEQIVKALGSDHFSWKWYLIVNFGGGNSECGAMSLNEDDLGSIYNCEMWTEYPSKEELFARSFTEFLAKLYEDRGARFRRDLFGFF